MESKATASSMLRERLAPQVAERLRDDIVSGIWPPGAQLKATELSGLYGVSYIPVQGALLMLESEGFVHMLPHGTANVVDPTIEDTAEKLSSLKHLEGVAAERAARAASDEALSALGDMQFELEQRFMTVDMAGYHALNQALHSRIVELAADERLTQMHKTLSAHLEWAVVRSGIRACFIADAPVQHGQLTDVLRKRDALAARRVAEEHFELVSGFILEGLRKMAPPRQSGNN